jgi:hypothetical protein
MKLATISLIGALAILLATIPLIAHHSFAATYNEDAPLTEIKGTMKSFKIQNPHSYVQIEDEKLKDKEGTRSAGLQSGAPPPSSPRKT